jgi:hypothetical protein
MKKKAGLDIGGLLGDGICAIVGAETAGAGFFACEALKKGIQSVVSSGQSAVQSAVQSGEQKPDIMRERWQEYQNLSNLLRTMGCTEAKYTDPKQLQYFFEGPSAGNMLTYNGPEGALKIAKGLENFIAQGVLVKSKYPDFVNKSIDWVFNYYKRGGYDLNGTLQQLQKLQNELTNPAMVDYVIAILNNNYFGAIMFKLMMSVGEKDLSVVTKEYGETMQTAVKILGRQSPDVLNFQDAVNENAKATFDQLALSEQAYNIHLDMSRERAKRRRELIEQGGPMMISLLDSPFAHWINWVIPLMTALGQNGVAGQALSQLGKKT